MVLLIVFLNLRFVQVSSTIPFEYGKCIQKLFSFVAAAKSLTVPSYDCVWWMPVIWDFRILVAQVNLLGFFTVIYTYCFSNFTQIFCTLIIFKASHLFIYSRIRLIWKMGKEVNNHNPISQSNCWYTMNGIWFVNVSLSSKGSLGAVVKLLPCDHEVTGSSPGNSLLQKCMERLRTKDASGRTLPLTLRKRELRALDKWQFWYSN